MITRLPLRGKVLIIIHVAAQVKGARQWQCLMPLIMRASVIRKEQRPHSPELLIPFPLHSIYMIALTFQYSATVLNRFLTLSLPLPRITTRPPRLSRQ